MTLCVVNKMVSTWLCAVHRAKIKRCDDNINHCEWQPSATSAVLGIMGMGMGMGRK